MIELAGGAGAVFTAIDKAQAKGDYQWGLQLVDRLIFADDQRTRAEALKAELLLAHAEDQINCPTRHYYIMTAKEISAAHSSGE